MSAFYGFQWKYGIAPGERAGSYYRFETPGERQRWLSQGPPDPDANGYREIIPDTDLELRRMIRTGRVLAYRGDL